MSKSKRTVTAFGVGGKVLAQYPNTIGDSHDPLPIGHRAVVGIVHYPWFLWDPKLLWNVDKMLPTAELAPGPNNPVGTVWIGLSKPDYGIHGTPDPENIGHGVPDGCIRLTNWDVEQLSHMVRRGTPVELEE